MIYATLPQWSLMINKIMKLLLKARNINRAVHEIVADWYTTEDIWLTPIDIIKMQDEQILSLDYLDTIFQTKYIPKEWTIENLMDWIIRLNHTSFSIKSSLVQKYYFDQIHFSNFFKIFIDNLVCHYRSKGKIKEELFRDNSLPLKFIKRYLSCTANSSRDHIVIESFEKIAKVFKSFNAANMMNEEK